ncbi:MAG: twin-arginine translocase subunit TatC [Planctomycetaceae bacterium]
MARNRDLFDDTTMSFGEHLEVLRVHVWKSLIGVTIAVCVCLLFGDRIIGVLRKPITEALMQSEKPPELNDDVSNVNFLEFLKSLFSGKKNEEEESSGDDSDTIEPALAEDEVVVQIPVNSLLKALRSAVPELIPEPASDAGTGTDAAAGSPPANGTSETAPVQTPTVPLIIKAPEFAQFRRTSERFNQPVTFKVEEAFMAYVKVSVIAGFVLASPWVFYQIWLFVAAGLYPHERKYVHIYLPMSLGLFITGALFCFHFVFPLVLGFLISFNDWIGTTLQPRLSEYISLALMLPLMFGISFQLPLAMLFLDRLGIFSVEGYRTNRRMAILVIAVLSMILTPADPTSMLLMMFPLIILYEAGIHLCRFQLTGDRDPLK